MIKVIPLQYVGRVFEYSVMFVISIFVGLKWGMNAAWYSAFGQIFFDMVVHTIYFGFISFDSGKKRGFSDGLLDGYDQGYIEANRELSDYGSISTQPEAITYDLVPKTKNTLDRWKYIWMHVKDDVAKQYSVKDTLARFQVTHHHIHCDDDTLRKIIKCGQAGYLESENSPIENLN